MSTCSECGAELPSGWSNPAWNECVHCHPVTIRVNVGPQPHLMSHGEIDMHLRHRNDVEKRRAKGEIEVEEKGPLEFRPRHTKAIH